MRKGGSETAPELLGQSKHHSKQLVRGREVVSEKNCLYFTVLKFVLAGCG